MNQYTVLLVDDEEEVFQVIMKKLDWESMGFSIAGYARNGVEALEMAEELQPDVVMTDIKMPYMDGLTLCKKLKELYQKVKVIIFSGFDEFEYAKEAIKIEAEEYILKPINSNELREVFERIKVNLDKELDEKRNIDKLREYYMESLPVLQENFYTSLIEGRIPESQIEKYVQNYQINLTGPYYVVTVLHISTTNPENVPIDPFLLTVSVKKLAEEQLTEKWNCRTVTYLGDILVIAQLSDVDSVTHFTDDMDRFCKMAKRVCKATVTAGIGHVCNQLSQLSLSYHGAKNATSYRVLYGNTRAINIAEIVPKESKKAVPLEETKMQELFRAIHVGDQEKIRKEAIKETEKLHKNAATISQYNLATMEIVSGFFKFCANNSMDFNEISGNVQNLYERVTQLDESSMTNWIINMSMAISEKLRSTRNSTSRRIITDAQNIVKDRYMEPALSLDDVCADLGVSNSYFSSIFKKETGQSFVSYLTDYRMDRAEEMVLNTDEKSYKIAEKVGYQDANYFSYVFKKKFGVSPSKYRASGK